MKEIFNWIWIEILVIAITKKIQRNFLCFMDNQKKFPLQHAKQYMYLTKWWVPHNFMWTFTSWIYIYIYTLLLLLHETPGGRNDSLPYRRRRREERKRGHNRHHHLKLLLSLRVCYVFQCYVNATRVLSCLSWYLYDAKSKRKWLFPKQTTHHLNNILKSKKLQSI